MSRLPRKRGAVKRHGHSCRETGQSPTYKAWAHMKDRCLNKLNKSYSNYGGRGIMVCRRWTDPVKGFDNFLADMGPKPKGLLLDRKNNDGNYSPKNCRWVTRKEQNRNRRGVHVVTINGETHCIPEWAELLGLSLCTVRTRIKRGWSAKDALTITIQAHKPRDK